MNTKYQFSKIEIISADRHTRGTSAFSQWVRKNYAGKFIVSVSPFDIEGKFNHEPLKNRGYEFSGSGADAIERGLLAGKKRWFMVFDSADSAEAEIDTICETGI